MTQIIRKSLDVNLGDMMSSGVPVGSVMYWMGSVNNIPEGYFICNGSTFNEILYPKLQEALQGIAQLPDMLTNNRFIRCSNIAGTIQGDAIRNLGGYIDTEAGLQATGILQIVYGDDGTTVVSRRWINRSSAIGARDGMLFAAINSGDDGGCWGFSGDSGARYDTLCFDASRVVPTSTENRPYNISAIPIIKHD